MTFKPKSEDPDVSYTELYNGEVIVRFHEKSHMYYVSKDGGEKFVRKGGVTGIISVLDKSKPLGIWQQGMTLDFLLDTLAQGTIIDTEKAVESVIQHELFLKESQDIGHEIHAWCEFYIRHQLKQKGYEKMPQIPDFPEAIRGVNSFMAWIDEHNVKFLSTERVIYSMKHDYIGQMDFEAVIDGKHCMGDFKSSNGLYPTVRLQTAAYAMADMEESGKSYDGRFALRLSKYSEEEYIKRELRKKEVKAAIARFKGSPVSTYPIKPYKVFEDAYLDDKPGFMLRDFKAFNECKKLTAWQRETDPFLNKELNGSL